MKKLILLEGRHIKDFMRDFSKHNFDVRNYVKNKVDMTEQPALIMCSSGTTGLPKGVITTQSNLMACTTGNRYKNIKERLNEDIIRIFNIGPWFHVLGFVGMYIFACSREHQLVFLARFEEETFYKAIQKFKVNFLTVVPPIMVMLAKSPKVDQYDLSSVKEISSGAAPLSRDVEEQVIKRFNGKVCIRQGFGMSEVTYGVIATLDVFKPGSVGEALQGVYVKVIDESGRALRANQVGELCFKGARNMKGYVDDPQATSETIDKDGWLHSGDMAYYDEDKQFFVVDRKKELIKYNGFQVAPAELEGILLSNPKIKDCGVIGIPDERAGELPFAFVVKQPGVELTEGEVLKFVKLNVSKTKWLRGGCKFIDAIPKSPSGKILRKEMREIYKNMRAKL